MERLLLLLIVAFIVTACSSQSEGEDFGAELYYELTSLNTGMSGQIIKKEDLDFRESIEFFKDRTFTKQRVYSDSSSTASGRYQPLISEGNEYLKLQYNNSTYLIQTCGNSLMEYLCILTETEM